MITGHKTVTGCIFPLSLHPLISIFLFVNTIVLQALCLWISSATCKKIYRCQEQNTGVLRFYGAAFDWRLLLIVRIHLCGIIGFHGCYVQVLAKHSYTVVLKSL